jgi:hypothetical protein
MNKSRDSQRGIDRRDMIKETAAAGLGLAAGALGQSQAFASAKVPSSGQKNRIQLENAKPGTRDWLLTKTDITREVGVHFKVEGRIKLGKMTASGGRVLECKSV